MTRLREMTTEELGSAISGLGADLEWPPAPDVVPAVRAAISRAPGSRPVSAPRLSLPSRRRTLVLVLAAILLIAGVALAARLVFHIGAVTVRVAPGAAGQLPTDVVVPEHTGREVSLERAEDITGLAPAAPAALGPPDRVWVDEAEVDPETGEVPDRIVTAWLPAPDLPPIPETSVGALLMQFEGEWETAAKQLYAETNRFGGATIDGRRGFWTTGPHTLTLVSGQDGETLLVTGNVVIWEDSGSTFRLETALPKSEMVALAESLEPVAAQD